MPDLKDLRRWARGEDVEGLPEHDPVQPPDPINADREWTRFKVSADGRDALLKFGEHRGRTLSWLSERHRGYLYWILKSDFPAALKDIARYQLDKRDREMREADKELDASFRRRFRK